MKIDMMEKHPLGSQAFVPMNETNFLVFVAPKGKNTIIMQFNSNDVKYASLISLFSFIIMWTMFIINTFINNIKKKTR